MGALVLAPGSGRQQRGRGRMGRRERRSENLHVGVVRGTWPGSTGQKRDPGRGKGGGKVKGDGRAAARGLLEEKQVQQRQGRKKRRKCGPVVKSGGKCLIKREERRGRKVIEGETKEKGA